MRVVNQIVILVLLFAALLGYVRVELPEGVLPVPEVSQPVAKTKTLLATVTGYCICERCCESFSDGITATGTDASLPGLAVAPTVIPYGTKVTIPGYGTLVADDTGGAMRQAAKRGEVHVDIRFPSHDAALQWGRKTLPIEVAYGSKRDGVHGD